ncbi:MAG: hypothetical protein QG641_570 [Candidatus Poribacteria bacterium]|nr:hypothetical protein [Candidatus Poribacteria bacterium]
MKFKTTLILFGIAIVLFAFVYAFELRKPKDDKKSKNIETMLNISKDNLNRMEITYTTPKNYILKLSKNNNDQWQSQDTLESKPTLKAIHDTITSALERSIFDTVKEPGGLDEYGLAKPRVTVMFYFKNGTHRKIMLGSEVPIGNYVYIKEESTPDIYMVPASIVEDFTKLLREPENEKKQ